MTLRDSIDTFIETFFQWGTRLEKIIPCLTGISIFPPRIVLGYDVKNKLPPINVSSIIVSPSVKWGTSLLMHATRIFLFGSCYNN